TIQRIQNVFGRTLRSTVVAAAIALAECTPGGTASTGTSGSIGSFVSNLFGSKTGDQTPVAQNAAPIEASAPNLDTARHQVRVDRQSQDRALGIFRRSSARSRVARTGGRLSETAG